MTLSVQVHYKEIIEVLHEIIETELIGTGVPEKVDECIKFISSINSFGLISSEVIDELLKKYETDEWWRRLWGSIATQFEFDLINRLGIDAKEIAMIVMSCLDMESRFDESTGLTKTELAADRIGLTGTQGKSLTNINDFWLVCILLYRLTIHYSESAAHVASVQFSLNSGETPKATKKNQ